MAEIPTPETGHDWVALDPGSPYYYCARCRVSGKQVGSAWPPMRDPKFVAPEYRTCQGALEQKRLDSLKKYGLAPEDVEL